MNESISVKFTGICTHLLWGLGTVPSRRIVLVRADHGANILGKAIPPHIPKLRINSKHLNGDYKHIDGLKYLRKGVWQLVGAGLQLKGVADERLTPDTSYERTVPHLQSPANKIDAVDHEVVVHERAAAYFDIRGGKIKALKSKFDAVSTKLTVEISGIPELEVTCFWNRKTTSILLHPNATVNIEHTGTMLGDTAYDFLLHYLIFPGIPEDAVYPDETKKLARGNSNDISAGCSNSQYP
jgi:hypothetical protein